MYQNQVRFGSVYKLIKQVGSRNDVVGVFRDYEEDKLKQKMFEVAISYQDTSVRFYVEEGLYCE